MSPWLFVWLLVGVFTAVAFGAACWALVVRPAIMLGRTAQRLQDEMAPLAADIAREAERAGDRAQRFQTPKPGRGRSRR